METIAVDTLEVVANEASMALRERNAVQALYDQAHTALVERVATLIADANATWAAENAPLLQRKEDADRWWAQAETRFRTMLVAEYQATGKQTYHGGQVVLNHKYAIVSAEKAMDWCQDKAPTLLRETFDEKRLIKGIRDGIFDLGADIVQHSVEVATRLREDVLAEL